MRILGIDPGLTRCGIGVIDVNEARQPTLVHVGVIRSATDMTWHFRLLKISEGIRAAFTEFDPDIGAVERVFAKDNLQSVTTTMQVMGIALTEAARAGKPMAVHTPSEVKAAVTGNGNAPKTQVERMVARILGLQKPPKPADAADALAIAIAHAWRGTGILGAGEDEEFSVSLSGKVKTRPGAKLTPAQQTWAEAQAKTRRKGAVDPRRKKLTPR